MSFRLETLLKLRKNQEEMQQKIFAQANSHFLAQKKRLEYMEQVENKTVQNMNIHLEQKPDAKLLPLYTSFFNGIHEQEKKQQQIISEISTNVDAKRQALTEAMRKRKTLEILKERHLLEANKKRMKDEIDMLDEASSNLWRRQNKI